MNKSTMYVLIGSIGLGYVAQKVQAPFWLLMIFLFIYSALQVRIGRKEVKR